MSAPFSLIDDYDTTDDDEEVQFPTIPLFNDFVEKPAQKEPRPQQPANQSHLMTDLSPQSTPPQTPEQKPSEPAEEDDEPVDYEKLDVFDPIMYVCLIQQSVLEYHRRNQCHVWRDPLAIFFLSCPNSIPI